MTVYYMDSGEEISSWVIPKALERLCSDRNLPFIYQTVGEIKQGNICGGDEVRLFITQAGPLWRQLQISLPDVRARFPHAKVVIMASDTIYRGLDEEFPWWRDVDLFLECSVEVVEQARREVKAERWEWTISDWLADKLEDLSIRNAVIKDKSIISLYKQTGTPYRRQLTKWLQASGRKCTIGGGPTEPPKIPFECEAIHREYARHHFCLATSSSSWAAYPEIKSNKGFRDWIAPFCGTVLLKDNFAEIYHWPCPVYDYSDLNTLLPIMGRLKEDPGDYQQWVAIQREWARANTLDKQFDRLFTKHGLWPK